LIKIGRKGKYEEWLTPDGLTRLTGWARDGLTNIQIAQNIGISERAFTEWVARFPAISSALKKGKEPVDTQVENALLRRALGYTEEETITEIIEQPDGRTRKQIRKVQKVFPPDVTAQIFWLKNRKHKQWRDKVENEITMDTEDLSPLVELLRDD
jgi:hypothetical protein